MFYKFTECEEACQNCVSWIQHYVFLDGCGFIATNCGHCALEVDELTTEKHTTPGEKCSRFKRRKE